MEFKVRELLGRLKQIEEELGQPEAVVDQKKYRALSQEYAYLNDLQEAWNSYEKNLKELESSRELLKNESDPEFSAIIREDITKLEESIQFYQSKVETLLVPPDPTDHAGVIMELRAGTGGDEAAIFVGDCVRMYRLFADRMGWKHETLSCTDSEMGGYKEFIMSLSGKNANRFLQYEAGTHRVQRVPETEAQGRVHTSAITVAILLEPGEEEKVEIDEKDLRIDTYRSSGAGGQHVNTTDSAVRITHIPTGVVVYCQQERSQHKNKEQAMRVLSAHIIADRKKKEMEKRAILRSTQVGSGDRSERIRTYNFPQNRLTDHRINLTLYKLDQIMDGNLQSVCEALVSHFYQEKLTAANE